MLPSTRMFAAMLVIGASACEPDVRFKQGAPCGRDWENGTYADTIGIKRRDDGYQVDLPPREDGFSGFHLSRKWIFTIISDVPPDGRISVVLKASVGKKGEGCVRNAVFHVRWPSDIK